MRTEQLAGLLQEMASWGFVELDVLEVRKRELDPRLPLSVTYRFEVARAGEGTCAGNAESTGVTWLVTIEHKTGWASDVSVARQTRRDSGYDETRVGKTYSYPEDADLASVLRAGFRAARTLISDQG